VVRIGSLEHSAVLATYFSNFLILLIRLSVIFSFLPFFSGKQVPRQFKIGLILVMAYVLSPVVVMDTRALDLPIIIIQELLLGMTIGFAVRMIFWGVEAAGTLISDAVGMSIATMLNPEMGRSTTISTLLSLLTMLLFLALDLHHDLIYLIVKSYEIIPVTKIRIDTLLIKGISLSSQIFPMAIRLAAPVLIGMIIITILMVFISKAAPQMNIFFISMPVHLFVGLVILMLCVPLLINFLGARFSGLGEEINRIILMAKGS
jgi:flagellar biosynthesis protein FliR